MDCILIHKDNLVDIDFYVNTQKYISIDLQKDEWASLHPAYPHGNIPIPFFEDQKAISVEGVWEGLKLFETCGVDDSKFYITDMQKIRRTEDYYGKYIGHRVGSAILSYEEAYETIYKKLYKIILETAAKDTFQKLKKLNEKEPIIIIDDTENMMAGHIIKDLLITN